jgi:hypothetical protein
MLRTKIPRGRGVRRFKFLPLTEAEIEALRSVPSSAGAHMNQCSCGKNGDSRRVLAEIENLLVLALAHGHQLTIQPHANDYACDIDIGTSALSEEEALDVEELESAPYSAANHGGTCEACRCAELLPIEPILTIAAIGLNHGHAVQLQPADEGPEVIVTIASERHEAFDRPSGPVRIDTSAVQLAMRTVGRG